MLYGAIEQSPSAELVEPDILRRYFAKFDEQFFLFCDQGNFLSCKHFSTLIKSHF